MFDQLLQEMTLPSSVEGRYLLLLKLLDTAETLGGLMMKDEELTPENMAAITRLKAELAKNFSAEMQEVTSDWLKAIDQLNNQLNDSKNK